NKIKNYLETERKNIFYITGFFDIFFIFITENSSYICLSEMLLEQCQKVLNENGISKFFQLLVISKKNNDFYFQTIKEAFKYIKVKENIKNLSYPEIYRKFDFYKVLDNLFELNNTFSILNYMRMTKDSFELENIKKACQETYKISKKIPSMLERKSKLTELDIAKKIDILSIKSCGYKAFDSIVAFGKNTAFPHYIPSENVFYNKKRPELLVDFGTKYKNYCADMTITKFYEKSNSDIYKKMANAVLEAHSKVIEIIKPGILAKNLDLKVREIFDKYKMTQYFIHNTGHGVGLDIHELPSINYSDETILKENMVVAIEPGLYIKEIGGVRIEDTILITKNNHQILTIK
ncbi:MAG: M24 family metallopeptidase, partial [Elusimicrobiota bacterium]|nr:M24 family metallopeptidase [Elusimicrobiota bacterium]